MEMQMGAIFAVALAAATAHGARTALDRPEKYFYTNPGTNIQGRVMGEDGDYKLVRLEDVSWLAEAWGERIALDGYGPNSTTNKPLVKGRFLGNDWGWPGRVYNFYERDARLVAGALVASNSVRPTAEATLAAIGDDVLTNLGYTAGLASGLVKRSRIQEEFAKLKLMDRVVREAQLAATGTVEDTQITYEDGAEVDRARVAGDPSVWRRSKNESRGKNTEYHYDSESETWERGTVTDRTNGSETVPGSGNPTLKLSFSVARPDGWLRGESSPPVVAQVRAVGLVRVSGSSARTRYAYRFSEGDWVEDEGARIEESTNGVAWVAWTLGEATWEGADGGTLTYRRAVSPSAWGPACLTLAGSVPGIPSAADVGAVAAPAISQDMGGSQAAATVVASLEAVYLVIDLRPKTKLDSW